MDKNVIDTFFIYSIVPISTRVWSLVQEYPTCCRATKPVCPSCLCTPRGPRATTLSACAATQPMPRACALQKRSHRDEKPTVKSSPCLLQLEKAWVNSRLDTTPQKQAVAGKHPLMTSHCPCSCVMDVFRFWVLRVSTLQMAQQQDPLFSLGHEGVRHLPDSRDQNMRIWPESTSQTAWGPGPRTGEGEGSLRIPVRVKQEGLTGPVAALDLCGPVWRCAGKPHCRSCGGVLMFGSQHSTHSGPLSLLPQSSLTPQYPSSLA